MVNIGKEYTEILCTVLVIFCKSEVECLTTLIKEKIQKKKKPLKSIFWKVLLLLGMTSIVALGIPEIILVVLLFPLNK